MTLNCEECRKDNIFQFCHTHTIFWFIYSGCSLHALKVYTIIDRRVVISSLFWRNSHSGLMYRVRNSSQNAGFGRFWKSKNTDFLNILIGGVYKHLFGEFWGLTTCRASIVHVEPISSVSLLCLHPSDLTSSWSADQPSGTSCTCQNLHPPKSLLSLAHLRLESPQAALFLSPPTRLAFETSALAVSVHATA